MTTKRKYLVCIPTYNEAENVKIIYQLIRVLPISNEIDLLFVDDNSPDGTGKILEEMKKTDPNFYILHRSGKSGIGSAHQAGIAWAYDQGYEHLVTMDCDLTHSPDDIVKFISQNEQELVVIGSRYLQKDSLDTWNIFRKLLTKFGHFLTKVLLDMPYDASGAFRYYRIKQMPRAVFAKVESKGYSFFFESLLILHLNNIRIKEVPIKLPKRTYGNSKMRFKDAWVSLQFLVKMFRKKTFGKRSMLIK
jgi:dolichol-phosphate mannosyltransferase